MPKTVRRAVFAVIVITLTFPALRSLAAQSSGTGTLSAGVSKLLNIGSVSHVSPSAQVILGDGSTVSAAGGTAALTSALAELFDVPVGMSRLTFAVHNALGSLNQYRAFEFVAPRLYYASRMYRLTCAVFEF